MSDRVARTGAQANIARIERLKEEIRECGCQGKHRVSFAHSRDELLGSEVVGEEVRGREWEPK